MKRPYNEKYMQVAICVAYESVQKGGPPFGACIVMKEEILACGYSMVLEIADITAHAEIQAIKLAYRKLGSFDLSGSDLYTTSEPCPMCFSVCHRVRISRIIYGSSIADVKKIGYRGLDISAHDLKQLGKSKIEIIGGILREETLKLYEIWLSNNF